MVIKCKMCGGDLHPEEENSTCECEFCGTVQTIPLYNDEKKINLFNRANRLRMAAEFDKAAAVYETIVSEFPNEAEAYWGLCLCTYGIEYVDDPVSNEKKPTCHRTLPSSIMEDSNFENACDNADVIARRVYHDEAKAIDRIQKDILSIVSKEEPYDVFICYKETDEEGGRTEDSVQAQNIYDSLVEKGLKVFFARISLENKLGQQYEPYIYAALSSAKVMVVVGTRYEYFYATWVKNEWARFLSMSKKNPQKTLIPCFKGLDAYDIPKEFKNVQAQDMGKIGWLQDLTRGIMKLCGKGYDSKHISGVVAKTSDVEPLLKRIEILLQEGNWEKADTYIDRVLDIEPQCGRAYFFRFLKKNHCKDKNAFRCSAIELLPDVSKDQDFDQALTYADVELKEWLIQIQTDQINRKLEQEIKKAWNDLETMKKEEENQKKKLKNVEMIIYQNDVNINQEKNKIEEANMKIHNWNETIEKNKDELARLQQQMNTLGLLSFGKKKALREQIETLEKKIRESESFRSQVETMRSDAMTSLTKLKGKEQPSKEHEEAELSSISERVKELDMKYRKLQEKLPDFNPAIECQQEEKAELNKTQEISLKELVYRKLFLATEPVSITEFYQLDNRFSSVNLMELAKTVRELLMEGKLSRTEKNHRAYFSVTK